jgi:hypothetical protein
MILGDGVEDKGKKDRRGKYGTMHERMTSPGREYMREYKSTPNKDGKKKDLIKIKSTNGADPHHDPFAQDINGEARGHDESKNSELEESFNVRNTFHRSRKQDTFNTQKVGVDKCSIYSEGPITKYIDSICKLPYEIIPDFSSVTVTKIVCGYHHMLVQLDNGMVFVSGNNSQGQLGLDMKKYHEINELIPHQHINDTYEIVDIGAGSNHSVFLAIFKQSNSGHREILTCGYHGCLGVLDANEDTNELQNVKIPDLDDYDKIDYLICKFNSSAVLDNENNLYYWGDDFDGFRERIPEKKVLFDSNIVDISFGFRHAVALLETGDVYTWGDGTYGEINSLFSLSDESKPIKINYFNDNNIDIIKVEAGCRHSIFLDKKGNVYGCGLTKGDDHKTERIIGVIKLDDVSDFNCIDVFSGETANIAIDQNGVPFKWEGVTGKYEIISDVSGRYIHEVNVSNRNLIILA